MSGESAVLVICRDNINVDIVLACQDVAISVDEKITARRIGRKRIWASILNAFGEVYYLVDIPVRRDIRGRLTETEMDHLAWQTGRSTEWIMLEFQGDVERQKEAVDGEDYKIGTIKAADGVSTDFI